MMPRPWLSVVVVLLAYAFVGYVDCRESEACKAPAVTHNEVFR